MFVMFKKRFFYVSVTKLSLTLALSFALHFQSGARQSLNLAIRPDYLDIACITPLLFCLAYHIILILQYLFFSWRESLSLSREWISTPVKGQCRLEPRRTGRCFQFTSFYLNY